GVLVAVLGTGVDTSNAQFGREQVIAGPDYTNATKPTTVDCDGRGTFAAGLIGARVDRRTTFAGIAPGVRLLAVRYVQATSNGSSDVDPDKLAQAIEAAVRAHAKVICVVVPSKVDSARLRAAVGVARAADAVLVAPASEKLGYPAATAGVLAVGAIDQSGAPVSEGSGGYLGIAAPGQGLVGIAPTRTGAVGHIWPIDDPAYAAAFVAGTAALVRAYRPSLSANQVIARLEHTAGRPAAAGGRDPRLGWGVVNPYLAVASEGVDAVPAGPAPAVGVAGARPVVAAKLSGLRLGLAAGMVTLAVLVAIGTVVVRRGRARGWRSGTAP
ncbi:MAG: S8 family serine peptidase, partial [Micromonosporaceae bacterium]|nr:S8 family serine peptidase [Micromonosporaceae bacterium]